MYLFASGIDFASLMIFLLEFGTVTLNNDSAHINVDISLNTGTFSYIFTFLPIQ